MFKIIAFICLASVSHSDCGLDNPNSFRDISVVGVANNEIECGRRAMFDPAKSAPFRDLAEGEYIKVSCLREKKANTAISAMEALKREKQK